MVTFDWWALAPAVLPAAGALLILLVDALLPTQRSLHAAIAVVSLAAAIAAAVPGALAPAAEPRLTLCLPGPHGACLWTAGPAASTLQLAVLLCGLAVVLLLMRRLADPAVTLSLVLASLTGGVAVAAARDLGTWLVALELATLPVVALVALRGTRAAAHGALSFLTTLLLSFALLVLGAGLWLTATGDPTFSADTVATALGDPAHRAVLVVAVLVLLAGLGFKLSLVPFHAWTPQAFSTGPLPIAVLLATASKLGALAALLVLVAPFASLAVPAVAAALGGLAILSMLVGTVLALRQSDAIRFLAWSTIAQAGWVVLPLAALRPDAVRASAAYLLTYAVAALVAFCVVAAACRPLSGYAGLLRSRPLLGVPLALALLVFAGLPPGVLGLVAKVLALRPVVGAGLWPLAVLAVLGAVLGIAVYVRWLAILLAAPRGAVDHEPLDRGIVTVIAAGTIALVLLSALPQLLLGLLS
jgi:NADH-quinone oxidoreductase subunit N